MRVAQAFLTLFMIALLCGSAKQVSAQEKKFLIKVKELQFVGKPFRYQFWIQREQDQVASMELVVLPAEIAKLDPRKLSAIADLTTLAGHHRVQLTAYPDPPVTGHSSDFSSSDFRKDYPSNWIGSIKDQDIKTTGKNQGFVYQLVVTNKNQKPVRSEVKKAEVVKPRFEVLSGSDGLSWFTTPPTEVMVERQDWLPLIKQIAIAKPQTSSQIICDVKSGEEVTPLKLSAPVASWTNSKDGKHLFVLQTDGLLLRIAWSTLAIERKLHIAGKGTQVALSKSHVIVTDDKNQRTWCIDRKTMKVKQVIPLRHSQQIAADRDSETCLIFNETQTSIVNLAAAKVTHSFPTSLFSSPLGKSAKIDANLWFCDGKMFNLRNWMYRFIGGHLLRDSARSFTSAPAAAVSPLGTYSLHASGKEASSLIDTADNEFPLRTFADLRIKETYRRKRETLDFSTVRCATIDDTDQSVFLGLDSEIVQLGIDGREVGAYPMTAIPRRLIASPEGDSILVASDTKAFRLSVTKPKLPAIMKGNKLAVSTPDAKSADILQRSANLPKGAMTILNLNFADFLERVVFHPNGNSFFVVSDSDQLLEIDLKENRIKRIVDLEMPVSDVTATSKGLAVLLKTTPKLVFLDWESLQVKSSLRFTGGSKITGHPNSEFLLAWRYPSGSRPLRVFNLDSGKLASTFHAEKTLSEHSRKFRPVADPITGIGQSWPTGFTKFRFDIAGEKIRGDYFGIASVIFNFSPEGEVSIDSLVPIPKCKINVLKIVYDVETELTFERISEGIRISDKDGNEVAAFSNLYLAKPRDSKRSDFEKWARSPDGKKLISFGNHLVVFDLVIPASAKDNVEVDKPAIKSSIGPTPREIWQELHPVIPALDDKEEYQVQCHESNIFVSKDDHVLNFDLATKKFLAPIRCKKFTVTQDGKYLLYYKNERGKYRTVVLNSNMEEVPGNVDQSPDTLFPIPHFRESKRKTSSVFLFKKSTTLFDIDSRVKQELAEDFFTFDYHINSNRILGYLAPEPLKDQAKKRISPRSRAPRGTRDLIWIDSFTGAVQDWFTADFLAEGSLITTCRVSHSGDLAFIRKTKGPKCGIIDFKNNELIWEGEVGKSSRPRKWSKSDSFILIGSQFLLDLKKREPIKDLTSGYKEIKFVPNTDFIAGLHKDKRRVDIIDPIKRKIVRSIGKREMIQMSLKDPSEKRSTAIDINYEEFESWDCTRDGKFLVTFREKGQHKLNFFDLESGEFVQDFDVPKFE